MNGRLFSEAMNEVSDKYITEAIRYQKKKNSILLQIIKYAIAACLVLVIGLGIIMTASVDVRAAVFGWMKEVYSGVFYKYSFQGTSKEATDLLYKPGWLPENIEYITTYEVIGGESYIYVDDKDLMVDFTYSTDPDFVFYMDGVDNIVQPVMVNGSPGEIYITPSEEETNAIIWKDDSVPVIFVFMGEFDAETLLKVAENIEITGR